MGEGRTEQREDAVAGGLGYVTVIVMDGVDHHFHCWIDDGAGLFRVVVLDQLHRFL